MKKYYEINVGDKETLTHTITKTDIEKFVQLTGDDNLLHVDENFASKTQFKKPVVHGMLGASFISTIIGTKLPGDGALWFSQSLEFLLPVRIGDMLTVVAEVLRKYEKEQIIELSKDGYNVIIHYNKNKALAEEIQAEVEKNNQKAIIVCANILDDSDIKDMISKGIRAFAKIDFLVNCAATVIPNIKFQNLQWTDFLQQMEVNIKSNFTIIQAVVPEMIKNGYGKIVNIGSLSTEKPNADWSHYITAKSALIGLTKSLAFELAPKGIRINMVTPSLISTELTSDIPEKIKLLTAAQTPLRRLALVSDVAGVISFLASEKSDFLVGENIRVNGGQVMI